MQYNSNELRKNAADCAKLADHARSSAERARHRLMEKAWLELANAQAWLDGEHSPLDGSIGSNGAGNRVAGKPPGNDDANAG